MDMKIESKIVPVFIFFIVLFAIGYFTYYHSYTTNNDNVVQVDIRKFTGKLSGVEENIVKLHGIYSVIGLSGELAEIRDFSFKTDANTQFKKLVITWPEWKTLTAGGKTNGRIVLKDLPKVESEGSLEDLQSFIGSEAGMFSVEAEFSVNIYNLENPVASLVFYQIVIMPKQTPTQ